MKNVKIMVSEDGIKWKKLGTYLNREKAMLSIGWKNACDYYPYKKIVDA